MIVLLAPFMRWFYASGWHHLLPASFALESQVSRFCPQVFWSGAALLPAQSRDFRHPTPVLVLCHCQKFLFALQLDCSSTESTRARQKVLFGMQLNGSLTESTRARGTSSLTR